MCHPGGPKVLEAIEDALGLPRDGRRADLGLAGPDRQPVLGLGAARLRGHPARPPAATRVLRHAHGDGSRLLLRAGAAAAPRRRRLTGLVLHGAGRRWSASSGWPSWSSPSATPPGAWSTGGVETGRGHYPLMVVLHTGLLVGMLVEAWRRRPDVRPPLAWTMLALVVASQALRWWCIATLGRRWNTRVIVVPGLPLVRRALPLSRATRTTSRSWWRASRCPWCTPRGSRRWSSRWPTPCCSACGSGSENAALATVPSESAAP